MNGELDYGSVKKWFAEHGYGFISPDAGGNDVFFHISALIGSMSLGVGDRVEYALKEGKDGRWKGVDVRLIEDAVS